MGLFCKKVCQIISVISASIALKLSIVCQILMVQIEGSNVDFGNASFVSQLENICIDQVNEPV